MPTEEELFINLAGEILSATERLGDRDFAEDEYPTAADLARKFNYRLETVKKKLRLLKEQGLIQTISVSPKRYRFNHWALKNLDPAHALYTIFCEPESPHYIDV